MASLVICRLMFSLSLTPLLVVIVFISIIHSLLHNSGTRAKGLKMAKSGHVLVSEKRKEAKTTKPAKTKHRCAITIEDNLNKLLIC